MKLTGKALRRGAVGVTAVLLVAGVIFGNVYVTNTLLREDKPAVTITPTTPLKGERGEKGEKGDGPTQEEIKQAVADYCAATGLCDGRSPSQAVVYAAVTRYCEGHNCRGSDGSDGVPGAAGQNGRDGSDGQDAPAVTDAQIQAQVAAYCAANGCTGEPGEDGLDGAPGVPGSNGRTPVIACVVRSNEQPEERYVAWKYDDEPDTAYRNLYRIPQLSTCNNEIDLRTI